MMHEHPAEVNSPRPENLTTLTSRYESVTRLADAVVGGQPPVGDVADQRRQRECHQSRRGGRHLSALLRHDDQTLNVIDPPLVDTSELFVEPLVLPRRVPEQHFVLDLSASKYSNVARNVARKGASAYPNRSPLAAKAIATWVRKPYASAAINAWNRASLESKY
jgi:hypothetical protein